MRLCGIPLPGGPITTTGLGAITICSQDLSFLSGGIPNNTAFHCEGILIAADASNNSVSMRVARTIKMVSGTLSALGTVATAISTGIGDVALSAVVGGITNSGNTAIILQATGLAATNITWNGFLYIWSDEF